MDKIATVMNKLCYDCKTFASVLDCPGVYATLHNHRGIGSVAQGGAERNPGNPVPNHAGTRAAGDRAVVNLPSPPGIWGGAGERNPRVPLRSTLGYDLGPSGAGEARLRSVARFSTLICTGKERHEIPAENVTAHLFLDTSVGYVCVCLVFWAELVCADRDRGVGGNPVEITAARW